MQVTYRELGELIKSMTEVQANKPFKLYHGVDGELHPYIGHDFSLASRIIRPDLEMVERYGLDPNQIIIEEYFDEASPGRKSHIKIQLIHLEALCRVALDRYSFARCEYARLASMLMNEYGEEAPVTREVKPGDPYPEPSKPYIPYIPTEEDLSVQVTYDQLLKDIQNMTEEEKVCPVMLYDCTSFDVYPGQNQNSSLVLMSDVSEFICFTDDEIDPDQWVLFENL